MLWKIYVAVIFGITALVFYPVIVPFLGSEKGKRKAFRLFVAWSWSVRIACFYFVVKKVSNPIPNEPHIIVSNHSSFLDIFLMYSIFPQSPFLFLGKSEILSYPLIKTYFKKMNIPVYRSSPIKSARALIKAGRAVKEGWSLMIFPEGGIPDGDRPKMIEFKDGAFQLAKNLGVPIVPVTYTNHYKLFSDPSDFFGPARPGVSHVYIHPAITAEEIEQYSQIELRERCFAIINEPIKEVLKAKA